jgi:hypothetical protein
MSKRATAPAAEAGAAAPATVPAKAAKPAHHQPTAPRPRDQYTGKGGTYQRDPVTGERTPVTPVAPAAGDDAPAAA